MMSIKENIDRVKERISAAAARAGVDPNAITIVAVSKTVSAARVDEAIRAGITDIGENKVQEAAAKIPDVIGDPRWHMVGHLQRNKVKKAIELFDLIQSVDSVRLIDEIDRRAQAVGKVVDVLIQVNTSGEESKFGLGPGEIERFMEYAAGKENVNIRGLMTIGLLASDPEDARPSFVKLREIRERVKEMKLPRVRMDIISMGMTNDFEIAIEEGSNMVRIGRAIFGERR